MQAVRLRLTLLGVFAGFERHHASAAPRLRAAEPFALAAEVAFLRAKLDDLGAQLAAAMTLEPKSSAASATEPTAAANAPVPSDDLGGMGPAAPRTGAATSESLLVENSDDTISEVAICAHLENSR